LSSLGVYSGHLQVPYDAFGAGLADLSIVTTLCPGGKERMRRLMNIVGAKRFPFGDLITHSPTMRPHAARRAAQMDQTDNTPERDRASDGVPRRRRLTRRKIDLRASPPIRASTRALSLLRRTT
jgi:hypothetical protein